MARRSPHVPPPGATDGFMIPLHTKAPHTMMVRGAQWKRCPRAQRRGSDIGRCEATIGAGSSVGSPVR